MLFWYGIPILWRTMWPWNLFKDLLQKCVQCPAKMWTMMNGSVCSACQLRKLGSTPWNLLHIATNSWTVWSSWLTLLLTIAITSHNLQGLTITPFKFHLLKTTSYFNSFGKPPGYGMNYWLRSSHLYTHLLVMFLFIFIYFLGTWSVLAGVLPMYSMSCKWIIYLECMHALCLPGPKAY